MATLLDTTDAMIWAQEFCRIFNGKTVTSEESMGCDPGTMVGWFANAIETGRSNAKRGDPQGVLHAFLHFYHLDYANAQIHTSSVRFSPVTFRLQEYLFETHPVTALSSPEIADVMEHNGKYEEDRGR